VKKDKKKIIIGLAVLLAVLLVVVLAIPLIAMMAANPTVPWTKIYSWRTDECRTIHVDLSVTDNSAKPRPIDIVLLRDMTVTNKSVYQGHSIDYWLDIATDQLIDGLYAIPNSSVKIAYGTYNEPSGIEVGVTADAVKQSNFFDVSGQASLKSIADTYGGPDPSPSAPSDSTNMERAISMGRNMLATTSYGARTGALKVILMLTDGFPTASMGQTCSESIFVQPNNKYMQAAVTAATPFLDSAGKIIYFSMMNPTWLQSYFDRVAETENKIAAKRPDGSPMAYRADLGNASLAAQVAACTSAMSDDVQEMNTVTISDTLTSQAIDNGLAGQIRNLSSGLTFNGSSIVCSWNPSTTGATWSGSYDIHVPSTALLGGSLNFPISTFKVTSYSGSSVAYIDTDAARAVNVPSEIYPGTPVVSGGSTIVGQTMTLTVPSISGGTPPYNVLWTRNIDGWATWGQSVNVVSTGDATYTETAYDSQTCYAFAPLTINPPRGTVYVSSIYQSNGQCFDQYQISGYSGSPYTATART
jgi:hypothetical protein